MLTRSARDPATVSWCRVRRTPAGSGGTPVKKLLVVAAVAAAAFAVWRKVEADKAEQALWAEVTDPVD
jgi:hypothetical protein